MHTGGLFVSGGTVVVEISFTVVRKMALDIISYVNSITLAQYLQ